MHAQQVAFSIHQDDLQTLSGHAFMTHMTGATRALINTAWGGRRRVRTRSAQTVRSAVRLGAARKW